MVNRYPTLAQVAAKYGADPRNSDCSGLPPVRSSRKSSAKQTSAQKLADQAKKAKDGTASAK